MHILKKDIILYFIIPILMFSYLFTGNFLIPGTDSLFHIIPNILHAKNEFDLYGEFTLWNKFIFAGFDMTSSMHSHYLNPINWPLFLLPKSLILHGWTFYTFLFCLGTGLVFRVIGKYISLSKIETLVLTIFVQSSSFFWFLMTSMIGPQMLLGFSLLLLGILGIDKRTFVNNFVIFVISFFLILIYPHLGYIIPFLTIAFFVFLWKLKKNGINFLGLSTTVIFLGFVFAFIVALYRLYPAILEIINTHSIQPYFPTKACDYAFLTMFDPIALGRTLGLSLEYGEAAKVCPGFHIQIHNVLPLGVLSFFIVYLGIRIGFDKFQKFFVILFILFSVVSVVSFKPLHDMMRFLLYPIGTTSVTRIIYFLIFSLLLIISLKKIRSFFDHNTKDSFNIYASEFLGIVLLFIVFNLNYLARGDLTNEIFIKFGFETSYKIYVFKILNILGITLVFCLFAWKKLFIYFKFKLLLVLTILNVSLIIISCYFFKNFALPDKEILKFLIIITSCNLVYIIIKQNFQRYQYLLPFIMLSIISLGFLYPLSENSIGNIKIGITISHLVFSLINLSLILLVANIFTDVNLIKNKQKIIIPLISLFCLQTLILFQVSTNMYQLDGKPTYRSLNGVYPPSTLKREELKINNVSNIKNYIINKNFKKKNKTLPHWIFGGKNTLQICKNNNSAEDGILNICAKGIEDNTIFQNIKIDELVKFSSFSIKVKAPFGSKYGIFLSQRSHNVGSPYKKYIGTGKWQSVTVTLNAKEAKTLVLSPHLHFPEKGKYQIKNPLLVINKKLVTTNKILNKTILKDLKYYRISDTSLINGYFGNEVYMNYNSIDRIPSYTGVDSTIDSNYKYFLNKTGLDNKFIKIIGVVGTSNNLRFLSMLGVKYYYEDGYIKKINHTIPRFSLFYSANPVSNFKEAIKKLSSFDFDIKKNLILETDKLTKFEDNKKFIRLNYIENNSDYLFLKIEKNHPRFLMFNDRYNKGWKAYFNNNEIPIVKANGIFMGLVLPEGGGQLVFKFEPIIFNTLSVWSKFLGLVFLLIFLTNLVIEKKRKYNLNQVSRL